MPPPIMATSALASPSSAGASMGGISIHNDLVFSSATFMAQLPGASRLNPLAAVNVPAVPTGGFAYREGAAGSRPRQSSIKQDQVCCDDDLIALSAAVVGRGIIGMLVTKLGPE